MAARKKQSTDQAKRQVAAARKTIEAAAKAARKAQYARAQARAREQGFASAYERRTILRLLKSLRTKKRSRSKKVAKAPRPGSVAAKFAAQPERYRFLADLGKKKSRRPARAKPVRRQARDDKGRLRSYDTGERVYDLRGLSDSAIIETVDRALARLRLWQVQTPGARVQWRLVILVAPYEDVEGDQGIRSYSWETVIHRFDKARALILERSQLWPNPSAPNGLEAVEDPLELYIRRVARPK